MPPLFAHCFKAKAERGYLLGYSIIVTSICFSTPCNDKHKTAVAFWKSSSFAERVLYVGNQRHLVLIPKASKQFVSSGVTRDDPT